MDAKPKTRWYQFSLRTLLVLLTVACSGFGWLGYKVRQAKRQQRAVAVIEKLGGQVTYNWDIAEGQLKFSTAGEREPAWLRDLLGFDLFSKV